MIATISASTPIMLDVYAYSLSLSFILEISWPAITKRLPNEASAKEKGTYFRKSKIVIHTDASALMVSYAFIPATKRSPIAVIRNTAPINPIMTATKSPKKLSANPLRLNSSANAHVR